MFSEDQTLNFPTLKWARERPPEFVVPCPAYVLPGEGQHLPLVGLGDPLLDSLLDTPALSLSQQRKSRATWKSSRGMRVKVGTPHVVLLNHLMEGLLVL